MAFHYSSRRQSVSQVGEERNERRASHATHKFETTQLFCVHSHTHITSHTGRALSVCALGLYLCTQVILFIVLQ